ncbi:hypothetical protein [Sphingopyxis sp. MWB1]|uniref:hypothetical protein n=1 Tax=Sphingopyxis sp. MWB1 TaxID=1537715 RepID=UPI00051A2311|nr:hypothetical protein [Sphingopyxis sp. MWB1]
MIPALDYYIDAKRALSAESSDEWDIFISAFNDNSRVRDTFSWVKAKRKIWWSLPEYGYTEEELPNDGVEVREFASRHEAELIREGFEGLLDDPTSSICIDITGLMRQHIFFIMRLMKDREIPRYSLLYTEPEHYARKADTTFALGEVSMVRQVAGYEGQHSTDTSNDVLIMGGGYDHPLVAHVILSREKARLVQVHSLPSLSADMYHEALLRLDRVSGTADVAEDQTFFSSANDPFVTAATLSEACQKLRAKLPISNLYLSSLATKPQAVGFALFYLKELEGSASSVIFPVVNRYFRETGKGLGRTWVYPIELS